MRRDTLLWLYALAVVGGVALAGCTSNTNAAGVNEPVELPVADTGSEPNEGDDVWTPEAAAAAIGEAAAEAARAAAPDNGDGNRRLAAIETVMAAAVDQAMLVAPELGVSKDWTDAVRLEITRGVVQTEVPGQPGAVLDEFIGQRVEARSLEWIRSLRSGAANPH